MSSVRRSGASWAAQWPPRSNSLHETMFLWSRSTNLRIGLKSNAKLARPMGTVVGSAGMSPPGVSLVKLSCGRVGQRVGEGLRLGGLRFVVDRTVHEGLQELQVLKLLWGQALELGRVSRGEGENLVDVHADHV